MRIGLITLSFLPLRGGMEYVVHDLGNSLQKLGHEVFLFAPSHCDVKEVQYIYTFVPFGWSFKGAYKSGFNRFSLIKSFLKLHQQKPFDIINVHSAFTATTYALDLVRKFKIPMVITCHGHDIQKLPEYNYGLRLNKKNERIIVRNLRKADQVVSISDSIYSELILLLPENRISRIPNGVHIGLNKTPNSSTFKKRYGITRPNQKIILTVGRNHPKKGFETGIKAFSKIAKKFPETMLVHVGRDATALIKLSEDLGIKDQFLSIGQIPREDIYMFYNNSDIYFSPARIEGFALTNLEAMAAGLPCIVTDGPGNRDSVIHDRNGIIIPVENQEKMASALERLLLNEELCIQFGKQSIEIIKDYTWINIANKYLSLFSNTLRYSAL